MKKILLGLSLILVLVGCSQKTVSLYSYIISLSTLSGDYLMGSMDISAAKYDLQTKGETDKFNVINEHYQKIKEKIKNLGNAPDELKVLTEKLEVLDKSYYNLVQTIQKENVKVGEYDTAESEYKNTYEDFKRELKYYEEKYK